MTIKKISKRVLKSNERIFGRLLSMYPAFLFFGARVRFAKDFHQATLRLPLRWYFRNGHGTFFGGAILAISDPFPAIMLAKCLPWAKTWTKTHQVDFLLPGKSTLFAEINISPAEIREMEEILKEKGKYINTFQYYFCNKEGDQIALVTSTVYIRNPKFEKKTEMITP